MQERLFGHEKGAKGDTRRQRGQQEPAARFAQPTVQRAAPQSYMRPARASLHGGPVVLLCHSPRRGVEATLSLLARWAVMALHESGARGRVQSHGAGHLPLA